MYRDTLKKPYNHPTAMLKILHHKKTAEMV